MTEKKTNPKDSLGIRKVPLHCIPMRVLGEVGLAMLEGGRKYGAHNYRNAGVKASVYVDAVGRHLFLQWWEGEDTDIDSGLSHVTKAIASLIVLRDSMLMGNWVDDRPIRHPEGPGIYQLNGKAGEIIDQYPDCKAPFTEQKSKTDVSRGPTEAEEAHRRYIENKRGKIDLHCSDCMFYTKGQCGYGKQFLNSNPLVSGCELFDKRKTTNEDK